MAKSCMALKLYWIVPKKAMRGILRRKVTYVLCLTEKIGGSLKYKLEKGKWRGAYHSNSRCLKMKKIIISITIFIKSWHMYKYFILIMKSHYYVITVNKNPWVFNHALVFQKINYLIRASLLI